MAPPTDLDLELEERARLLGAWAQKRRQIAVLEAEAAELLIERIGVHEADVVGNGHHRDAIYRSMIAEYGAAGRISKGSMEYAFTDARTLRDSLPAVRAAFQAGAITAAHVREIARASAVLVEAVQNKKADAEALVLFQAAALVVAEQDTPARTRAHALRAAAALAGQTVTERHRRATQDRGVTVRSLEDGMALLSVVLPEWLARAILDRLTSIARHVIDARDEWEPVLDSGVIDDGDDAIRPEDIDLDDSLHELYENTIFGDDTFTTDPFTDPLTDPGSPDIEHVPADSRTLDQIRADLLTDLLLAAAPGDVHGPGLDAIRARIQVTVSATTLTGADDQPAEHDGHGPLDPDTARTLAGRNTGWTRLFTSPTGMLTDTDTYTPTEAMRRHLRARDQHCRFPGCRMPVHRCDIDHTHDHARGGRTRLDNLAHL
ncbi:HNH endonuclease signature motif containing protein, partial [Microbacterium sp. SD291]|uniref:HNH endonuclease signature motif containing protein n=1 Tax=Microbacterium sp. SD291 TaxID=2782007 RepID=UPI001A95B5B8